MKLMILCWVLSTAVAVPVRRSISSRERLPILIPQAMPLLPQLQGFIPGPQIPAFFPPSQLPGGAAPFTQGAMPPQAAQYGPWYRLPDLYNNVYGFPVGGMPPPVGGLPPPVGGLPPPVGGLPPPLGK